MLHPARLLRSPVLCESLFFGSSHGRRKPHISNILEITIVLWRPRFIPADMSTLEAIQRGACVAHGIVACSALRANTHGRINYT